MSDIQVYYEATPNPQSMKFYTTVQISGETVNITNAGEAARSPLAQKILGFPWAAGVFIGPTFVTVTKQEWVDWDIIAEPLSELIKEHLVTGQPVLIAGMGAPAPIEDDPNDSEPVRRIKQILRDEIRPAVAMDGGDITFDRYEDGRVFLHMHGSCAGCPSSTYTLKEGIEVRLKEAVPEVIEVVAV
jgi:NFU1 iron-sulfur cluster scaffold homolog, mitochondrial